MAYIFCLNFYFVLAIYYAELLGVKKTHIVRYKGFTKIEEFDYEQETDGEKNLKTNSEESLKTNDEN